MSIAVLIFLMVQVESSGNKFAVNKESGARGCLQIKAILLRDYNQHNKTRITQKDLFDPRVSVAIFEWTMDHYAIRKNLGREPNFRDYAGVWKQGLRGYLRNPSSSDAYWQKIMAKRKELNL